MHPYLRAYLAGIAIPTMVIPLVVAAVATHHSATRPLHLEDVVIFPIALVPNAWGLWNVLYTRLRRTWNVPIGAFGAALLLVLGPAGYAIQLAVGIMVWTPSLLAVGIPITMALYYLVWLHAVSRLNDVVGLG
jgi:hypothetical protein